jgi:hypothetical protein
MGLSFNVGDLTVHRVIEQETTFLPALDMLPQLTSELLAENRNWLREAGALDDQDTLINGAAGSLPSPLVGEGGADEIRGG